MADTPSSRVRLAYLAVIVGPLFFSTNVVFGRGVVDEVSPFTLALIRWAAVAIALSPFMIAEAAAIRLLLRRSWRLLLLLAFLGMWICGGGVYLALERTTAANATLIYTTSPVFILLLEAAFKGRPIGMREGIGALLAFGGVAVILLRGDLAGLLSLRFNAGDLIMVAAALSWAVYSIVYRAPVLQELSTVALLGLLAGLGAVLLLPVAALEWATGVRLPVTTVAWSGIAGIVFFASLLAFSTYQVGVRYLGATLTGIFMYTMPVYGLLLAVILLGERLESFHAAGIALVLGGVVLATFPAAWLREKRARQPGGDAG